MTDQATPFFMGACRVRAGSALSSRAKLSKCVSAQVTKGPHVSEVLSVDSSTAAPAPRRSSFRAEISDGPSSDTVVEETGTVKWFNVAKASASLHGMAAEGRIRPHIRP
jgi:hypothetical protein